MTERDRSALHVDRRRVETQARRAAKATDANASLSSHTATSLARSPCGRAASAQPSPASRRDAGEIPGNYACPSIVANASTPCDARSLRLQARALPRHRYARRIPRRDCSAGSIGFNLAIAFERSIETHRFVAVDAPERDFTRNVRE